VAINCQLKAIIQAEHQCIVRQPKRAHYCWEEMFSKWLNHAEKYLSRKNRIPIEKTQLSSWVHEQHKAYRNGELTEVQKETSATNGFDFHPRKTQAMMLSRKGKVLRMACIRNTNDGVMESQSECEVTTAMPQVAAPTCIRNTNDAVMESQSQSKVTTVMPQVAASACIKNTNDAIMESQSESEVTTAMPKVADSTCIGNTNDAVMESQS
jgi:hypothetical protein